MALATNQFTIIDYNDAVSLTCGIKIGGTANTSTAKTIIYDPSTLAYSPDWSAANKALVLAPVVTKPDPAGGSVPIDITKDLVQCKWSKILLDGTVVDMLWNANGTPAATLSTSSNETSTSMNVNAGSTAVISDVPVFGIKVTANKLSVSTPSLMYKFTAKYLDPISGLYLEVSTDCTFGLIQNGSNIAAARVYQVTDDTFWNASDSSSLQLGAELLRGITPDTTIGFQWYKANSTVIGTVTVSGSTTTVIKVASSAGFTNNQNILINGTARQITSNGVAAGQLTITTALTSAPAAGVSVTHTAYDADTGNGWELITDLAGYHTGCAGTLTTAGQTAILTVYAKDINGTQTYKCKLVDTESGLKYYDQYTMFDKADPLQVEIVSPGGNVFKNSQGSTVLQAILKRNGVEVAKNGSNQYVKEDGVTPYTITFTKLNKDGVQDMTFGGAGSKTAGTNTYSSVTYYNSVPISNTEVDVKATFFVNVN